MRNILIALLLLICNTSLLRGQGWERLYPLELGQVDWYDIVPMPDGGFLMSANRHDVQSNTNKLFRLSATGTVDWTQSQQSVLGITQPVMLPAGQDELLFMNRWYAVGGGRLVKTDANLNILWSKPVGGSVVNFLRPTPGGYLVAYQTGSDYSPVVIIKTDLNGDLIWQKTFSFGNEQTSTGMRFLLDIVSDNLGNIYLSGVEDIPYRPELVKISPSGDVIFQKVYAQPNLIYGFGSLAVVNNNRIVGSSSSYLAVLDSTGALVNAIEQPAANLHAAADGNLLIGYTENSNLHIRKITLDGVELWKHTSDIAWNLENARLWELPDGGVICIGQAFTGSGYDPYLIRTDGNGVTFSNRLVGKAFADFDSDCAFSPPGDLPAAGHIVQLEKFGDILYTVTDTAGNYGLNLDTGNYLLRVLPPNGFWEPCTDSISVSFTEFHDTVQQHLGLTPLADCPWPEISLGAPFLRRCFPSTYTVQYANTGPATAESAVVRLTLDPFLSLQSAALPYNEVGPQIFEFGVGDLPPLSQGAFTITVLVDCDSTTLGQTHCSSAEILIANDCPFTPISVPVITVNASCDGDSVQFIIRNAGGAPMTLPAEFIVIEDLIVMRQGTFQLNAQQETVIRCPADGSTMRMYAGQPPGSAPFFSPTAAIEACNGPLNPGVWNMFPEFSGNTIALDCQPNIGAYDPNDKLAVPAGYDTERYIGQGVPIDYTIRFQNTGTDTAFTVVIRDTLSEWLDPASVRIGPTSHPYTWGLHGKNVLEFRFDNILLPDSSTNLEASQGYVKFHIGQKPVIPLGTDIFNDAAIYFDYNAPVITNTTRHRVGKDFIIVSLWTPARPLAELRVFPNPVLGRATVELSEVSAGAPLEWTLSDAVGRIVLRQTTIGGRLDFQRAGLPGGIYWLQVREGALLLGAGKLLMH